MTSGAAPPYQNSQQGTFPAPVATSIPASLEVEPATVTCTFDGSGASGAFVLKLTFLSQAGFDLGTVATTNVFQPGDTGVMTWFPFVPPASAVGLVAVDSPFQTIDVTNGTGPTAHLDLYDWLSRPAIAFDGFGGVDISAAFDLSYDSYFNFIQGTPSRFAPQPLAPCTGNFAYTVADPTKFLAANICVPVGASSHSPTSILGIGTPSTTAIVGSGEVTQTGSGNVVPFALEVDGGIGWLLQMRIAGSPASYVTATNPFVLAAGDLIRGEWSTAVYPE